MHTAMQLQSTRVETARSECQTTVSTILRSWCLLKSNTLKRYWCRSAIEKFPNIDRGVICWNQASYLENWLPCLFSCASNRCVLEFLTVSLLSYQTHSAPCPNHSSEVSEVAGWQLLEFRTLHCCPQLLQAGSRWHHRHPFDRHRWASFSESAIQCLRIARTRWAVLWELWRHFGSPVQSTDFAALESHCHQQQRTGQPLTSQVSYLAEASCASLESTMKAVLWSLFSVTSVDTGQSVQPWMAWGPACVVRQLLHRDASAAVQPCDLSLVVVAQTHLPRPLQRSHSSPIFLIPPPLYLTYSWNCWRGCCFSYSLQTHASQSPVKQLYNECCNQSEVC